MAYRRARRNKDVNEIANELSEQDASDEIDDDLSRHRSNPLGGLMWNLSLPWWEFVVRGVIVYVFLLLILRVTGKRQTGQLAPFDLVLLLVLSNAVQNAMNGGDNTVLGGIISASTLIALHYIVAYLTFRSKKIEKWIEGTPRRLIHNGKLDENVMRQELLTYHELAAALRAAGCEEIDHVRVATLENNGQITISLRSHAAG